MGTNRYVTIQELNTQILNIEGVGIDVVQFASRKRRILDKLRYPEYPYTEKFNGSIDELIDQRILPVIRKEIVVDD